MKNELTPHIEYYSNGNVYVKGQKNSVGQREGLWEWFHPNGNILRRSPYKKGKIDRIMEWFDERGNINETRVWKDGEIIEESFDEQGNIIRTRHWKDGKLIETTEH